MLDINEAIIWTDYLQPNETRLLQLHYNDSYILTNAGTVQVSKQACSTHSQYSASSLQKFLDEKRPRSESG